MSSSFNPYTEWLDIPLDEQPPSLYRLLGVEVFESDTKVIDDAAVRLTADVFQKAAASEHSSLAQELMQEIGSARRRLTNTTRKARYDAELRVELGQELSAARDGGVYEERQVFGDIYNADDDEPEFAEYSPGESLELPERPGWLSPGDSSVNSDSQGAAFDSGTESDSEESAETAGSIDEHSVYEGESYADSVDESYGAYEDESYEHEGSESESPKTASQQSTSHSRRRILIIVGVLAVAAIGIGAAVSLTGRDNDDGVSSGDQLAAEDNARDETGGDELSNSEGMGGGSKNEISSDGIHANGAGATNAVPGTFAYLVAVTPAEREAFESDIQPLLSKFCERCHNADRAEGDLNLATVTGFDRVKLSSRVWAAAHRMLDSKQMPPEAPLPADGERELLMQWLTEMSSIDWARHRFPGPRLAFRKTRRQYERSVRDLFGITFDIRHLLPPDSPGFAGSGLASPVPRLPESERDQYRPVATAVAERVVNFDADRETTYTAERQTAASDFSGTKAHHIVVPMKNNRREWKISLGVPYRLQDAATHKVTLPREGRYRITVPLMSMDSVGGNTVLLKSGERSIATWPVAAGASLAPRQIEVDLPGGEQEFSLSLQHRPWWQWMYENDVLAAKEIEGGNDDRKMQLIREGWSTCVKHEFRMDAFVRLREDMLKGMKPLWISPEQRAAKKDYRHIEQMMLEVRSDPNCGRVGWESFRIEGPIVDLEDPINDHVKLARVDLPSDREADVKGYLQTLLPRAFQKRVADTDVRKYIDVFIRSQNAAREKPEGAFPQAMTNMLAAILTSDEFLFAGTPQPAPGDAAADDAEVVAVDGMVLASRLAWFFWQSIPDDRLLRLARTGQLRNPDTIVSEVSRMRDDPRANSFYLRFMEEWLGYEQLGRSFRPDSAKFPQINIAKLASMKAEPALLFRELVQKNRSALLLLTSRVAFVDQHLADHYQVQGVRPGQFKEVNVRNEFRGGMTGMAALLTISSSTTETDPVRRGLLFRERVLGLPVPAAKAGSCRYTVGVNSTSRVDQLKALSRRAECARCHSRIDPIGLALEQYDAIGRMRMAKLEKKPGIEDDANDEPDDEELRALIEKLVVTGTLDDGTQLASVQDLQTWLSETQRTQFARNLLRRLMEFALRRRLRDYDEPAVQEIYRAGLPEGFALGRMVERICLSFPFQHTVRDVERPEPDAERAKAESDSAPGNEPRDGTKSQKSNE